MVDNSIWRMRRRTTDLEGLANVFIFSTVITDPMDSKFDLEAYLTMKMADEAK